MKSVKRAPLKMSTTMPVQKKMKMFRLTLPDAAKLAEYAKVSGLTETELVEQSLKQFLGTGAEALLVKRLEDLKKLNKRELHG